MDDVLDESALEKVRTWRYKPAVKNDQPVEVEIVVKIRFRLKDAQHQKVAELWNGSDCADPKAERALYKAYRDGAGVPQDESLAMWLLKRRQTGIFRKRSSRWASIFTRIRTGRATT